MSRQRTPTTANGGAWSYSAGEWGRNRVRVFQRGSNLWIDYTTTDGERVRHTLGYTDQARAKLEADDIAARFGRTETRPPTALTLSRLFDNYLREITPTKSAGVQAKDRRTVPLLLRGLGASRKPDALNVRDWTSYIARRRTGELAHPGREGKPVRAQMLEQDCKLLLAILNWAERARDDNGNFLLERNPLRGLAIPREESPRRPVLTAEQFATVREKAAAHSLAAELFVCLLWYTGHRAASVRQLRWADLDLDGCSVQWRAEVDKIQYAHRNPLHADLVPLLERARAIAELTGDVYLFQSPRKSSEPISREYAYKLWREIADAAGIKAGSRVGTHSFRRAFANRLRGVPLRELKDLGGWKTEKTVIGTYLQPDQDAQRAALERL